MSPHYVCYSLDPWLETQTRVAQRRYEELGGRITVMIREGEGHYLLAPKDQQPIVEFASERWRGPAIPLPRPGAAA